MLQSHVRLRLKTDTGTEDVGQGTALLSKCVDDRCSWWSQRSLKHVAENAKHTVKTFVILGGSTIVGLSFPGDTSHHFRDEHKIDDQWRSQQGVLADVEEPDLLVSLHLGAKHDLRDCLMTTHEDLSIILIQGTLVVTNSWHILDNHGMIGMLALLVKDRVRFDHVVNNIRLGDLL